MNLILPDNLAKRITQAAQHEVDSVPQLGIYTSNAPQQRGKQSVKTVHVRRKQPAAGPDGLTKTAVRLYTEHAKLR